MSTDVTINGVGYMVMPGSYRADSTVISSSTSGTSATQADLSKSQREGRAVATRMATAGATIGGLGGLLPHVGPNWRPPFPIGELGIGPPPLADTRTGSIDTGEPRIGISTQDYGFLASNDDLYRWNNTAISVRKSSWGADCTGLAVRGDRDLFMAFGTAQDVGRWEDDSSTWTASVLGAGEKAQMISMIADRPVVVKPTEPSTIYVWTSTFSSAPSFELSAPVVAMVQLAGGLLIATNGQWYVLEDVDGAPGNVQPTTQPTTVSNDVYLVVHEGSTYASVDGILYRRSGLTGRWTRLDAPGDVSTLVSNGTWLFAWIDSDHGNGGIWCFDGDAWFYVHDGTTVDQIHPGPPRLVGATLAGSANFWALDDRDPDDDANYTDEYEVATAFQGASIARDKNWTQIGAEFHRPDNELVGSWSAQLQYSTDAGRTWSNAGSSQTVDDEHERITADISASSVTARVLMVRVNMSQTSGLAPILVALWADWDVTDDDGGSEGSSGTSGSTSRTHQRRWRFEIPAQDSLIDRNGALLGLSASTIRSNLWARLNQTSSFTDLDGTVHATTTITDIKESWPSPADQPTNVSTIMELTIVEGDQTV